jgi:ATP-dependent Lhr-like helicase
MEFDGCYYMTFKPEGGRGDALMRYISEKISREGIDTHSLVSPTESPVFEKYDDYIPSELLRKAYVEDKLRSDEIEERVHRGELV